MGGIRAIPYDGPRVETGAVQFGDDWPGIFIRGDNAAHYAAHLRFLLDRSGDEAITRLIVGGLQSLLASCIVTASAIEARSGETGTGSTEGESAVAKPDAQQTPGV